VRERRNYHAPARKPTFVSRARAVRHVAQRLQRFGWPRLEMLLIVGITGLAGFVGSVLLLMLGMQAMWQRYPLAIGIAYAVFLLQLWWWMHARHEDSLDLDPGSLDPGGIGDGFHGAGGDFGGAGASGSWDAPVDLPVDGAFDAVGDAAGDALGAVGDVADGEGCVVVFAVVVLAIIGGGLLVGALYLVWGAPMLMAELLVDAALSFGLYRNLRRQDREFWLRTAVRRTGGQFLLAAGIASLLGAVMAHQVPCAITLGEVLQGRHVVEGEGK
jgi:hypothetical protein